MTSELSRDPDALREEARASSAATTPEMRAAEAESARRRSLAAMAEHLLQPVSVHTLEIHGARHTRKTLLDPIFAPLVTNQAPGTTLGDVLGELEQAVGKLGRFGIFQPDPVVSLGEAPDGQGLDIALRVAELPRLRLHTGTDVGNTEGSAHGSLLWRNILGGAETLSLSAAAGTRTRSAYSAALSTPLRPGHPDLRLALEGLASATQKPWASHEELLRAATLRLSWRSPRSGDAHSLSYGTAWRQLTGLAGTTASPTVRHDAGDSVKTALAHTYTRDRRDHPLLPQRGYLVRTASEVAGWGPLGGDVAFAKTEAELAAAVPVPLPSSSASGAVTLQAGLRAGLICPLSFGYTNPLASSASSACEPTRINDRFLLGGPADVRGFAMAGLGPHDGKDAVGGDLFAAGSLALLLPITRAGRDSPLRLQLFVNGGRLVGLKPTTASSSSSSSASRPSVSPYAIPAALSDLLSSPPTTAVGLGLVYAHSVARFELNFGLPIIMRRGEESRKGLQVGVGINFL